MACFESYFLCIRDPPSPSPTDSHLDYIHLPNQSERQSHEVLMRDQGK